jgi:hypothetical protein
MPQVIEFIPVVSDARVTVNDVIRVCRDTKDGEAFRDLRTRLRQLKLWDTNRPRAPLRFFGVGGRTITRSPFMNQVVEASGEDAVQEVIANRLFDLNPLLAKAVVDLVAQRPHGRDEIYKHLGSFAYRGIVPSRPDLDIWLSLAVALGVFKAVGIAITAGNLFDGFSARAAAVEVDEFLEEDEPEPEPEIPTSGDEEGAAIPAAVAPAMDSAAVIAAISPTPAPSTPGGAPLPPALRHLAAANLSSPRMRERPVPPSRFAAGFSDEVLEETAKRIGAWWTEVRVGSQGHKPADFGLDPEGWVENADEVVYRIAVAAALAFRLDADREGVIRAFRALDGAGILVDLYQGTVPSDLPSEVDARALMLASLAARRCAEAPDLASSLDQKKSAAEAFAVLDAALGRGLFKIELLWVLRMLGELGVIRYEDLADYTALPYRLVRDQLFRLGFVATPYAVDAAQLTAASRAARSAARAAGDADSPDEVIAAFVLAAGCAYDCPNRKACDFPCRERLE